MHSCTHALTHSLTHALTHSLTHCVHVQLDVWILRDGKVVVFHDPDLTRMTGGAHTQHITTFKYSELPELSPNDPEWDQTSRCSLYPRDDCKKIPLLEDIFKVVPKHICFIIEFKQDSSQLIAEVHRTILEADRYDTVTWFSLKEKINTKLRLYDPMLPTLTSVDNMLLIVMAYYCGVMPFLNIPDKIFGITLDPVCVYGCVCVCVHVSAYVIIPLFTASVPHSHTDPTGKDTIEPAWLSSLVTPLPRSFTQGNSPCTTAHSHALCTPSSSWYTCMGVGCQHSGALEARGVSRCHWCVV